MRTNLTEKIRNLKPEEFLSRDKQLLPYKTCENLNINNILNYRITLYILIQIRKQEKIFIPKNQIECIYVGRFKISNVFLKR